MLRAGIISPGDAGIICIEGMSDSLAGVNWAPKLSSSFCGETVLSSVSPPGGLNLLSSACPASPADLSMKPEVCPSSSVMTPRSSVMVPSSCVMITAHSASEPFCEDPFTGSQLSS